ncbi:hypothetical protein G6K93_07450 [Agrobacterium rhizogenes]|nr:hypothetical protein [Rhizobium rhizogenes]
MTKQTHTVATDALATLGTIIDASAGRDAIHLAVEPVVAVEKLFPGQHVGFVEGGVGTSSKPIGIVDPFIAGFVAPGQHFWLVVYPRTITSLRHVWEHPAFDVDTSEPAQQVMEVDKKAASETWLRDFVAMSDCPDYETVIAAAINNDEGWSSEYLHFNGRDAHGEIPPEFWDHIEIVTGQTIRASDRAAYFSCSC